MWVALGRPSEKVIRQSCIKADKFNVYPYGGRTAELWWDKIKDSTTRFDNLQVTNFSKPDTGALAKLASRAMKLQINIQDGDVMVRNLLSRAQRPEERGDNVDAPIGSEAPTDEACFRSSKKPAERAQALEPLQKPKA